MPESISKTNDTKRVFKKLGTCSRTFAFLLNREFDNTSEREEQALDPLAGGILQKGHQCGMLWGATYAAGKEAYRESKDPDEAIPLAIKASQQLVTSFETSTKAINCRAITKTDFSKKFQMFWYMLFRAKKCFNLAEDWAPEAIQTAKDTLNKDGNGISKHVSCCTCELIKKMSGSDEEMVSVAGFSGGIGLSGNACGALSAAIWKNSKDWIEANPGKSAYNNPAAQGTNDLFCEVSHGEIRCHKITGKYFESIEEHSDFIENGGCEDILTALSSIL